MTTAAIPGLTVSAIAELLTANGYRLIVRIEDAVVGERPILGTHVLQRVVAQMNGDGTWRLGYLEARPGQPGGPIYQHDCIGHESRCGDLNQLSSWLTTQEARSFAMQGA